MRIFRIKRILAALMFAGLALVSPAVHAATPELSIKAAYLYKFASYIDWPDDAFSNPSSPLTVGVMGDDKLADELAKIVAGQTVSGRSVITRKISPSDPVTGLHILLIGTVDDGALTKALANAQAASVLTVTESEDNYAQGSMINLLVVENKVRFEVALPPAETAHLKISARMLSAAYRVIRSPK